MFYSEIIKTNFYFFKFYALLLLYERRFNVLNEL